MYKKMHEGVYDLGTVHDTKMVCDFNNGIISLFHLKYEKIEYITINSVEHILHRAFWKELWDAFLKTPEGERLYHGFIQRKYKTLSNLA